MKLAARDTKRFLTQPSPAKPAILLYGFDAMRVSMARVTLINALVGPKATEDMRLDRIPAADLRKEPARLIDAIKAQGFFPGPRAVLLEDTPNSLSGTVAAAVAEWREGDATLVVVAGLLRPADALRKLFETAQNAYAIAIYDDPPSRDEIERDLAKAGLKNIGVPAMTALVALGGELDPGDFAQVITKLSLYKIGDPGETSLADVQAIAPITTEADLDDAIRAVAEGRAHDVAPQLQRLAGQGSNAVALSSGVARHFRMLHAAASDSRGPDQWAESSRMFGPRRDQIVSQARKWGPMLLERALDVVMETDLTLRSSKPVPAQALVERACLRIAMLCPK